ncbi:hypothetical protein CIG19_16700 [Enterobacterales bacterium CwR94]|nr:hypothetical protein CIG19_16700 [Enterobacterales bacterium CwR94]
MRETKITVSVEWLDDCPKCENKIAFVSGPGYRTNTLLKTGDSVSCASCGHAGEIDADGESAWVEWDGVEGDDHA